MSWVFTTLTHLTTYMCAYLKEQTLQHINHNQNWFGSFKALSQSVNDNGILLTTSECT